MRAETDILNEVIPLIKIDEKNLIYFFSKAKDPKWFKPLRDADLFNPSLIPEPIRSEKGFTLSHWPQQAFLEQYSKSISDGDVSDKNAIDEFLKCLRQIQSTKDNFLLARVLFLCVMRVPPKHLAVDDIKHAFTWLKESNASDSLIETSVHEGFSLIVSRISDNDSERRLFKALLSEVFTRSSRAGRRDEGLLFFSDYGLDKFEGNHFDALALSESKPYVLSDALEVLTNELLQILKTSNLDESTQHWRPAVEEHHQNNYHNSAQSIIVGSIRTVGAALRSKNLPIPNLESWKNSPYFTFKRIYFSLVTNTSESSEREQASKKIIEIGLCSQCRHEIYQFLQKQFDHLETDTKNKILDLIAAITADYGDTDELNARYAAWEKLRWLEAISGSQMKRAADLRKEALSLTEEKVPEHPDFSSYMGATWIGPTSPKKIEELAQSSSDEIFELLSTFEDSNEFASPSKSGLSRVLQDFVGTDPVKGSSLVAKIEQLDFQYVSAILDGYSKAWNEKKYVPLQDLISKTLDLVTSEKFEFALGDSESKARWVIGSLCSLIESGTAKDENAFPHDLDTSMLKILKRCLDICPAEKRFESNSDSYTRAINEPRGRIFSAFIILTLRRARNVEKGSVEFKDIWNDLQIAIEPILKQQSSEEVSLHALLGAYYRQFFFLDKQWFIANIDIIAPSPEKAPALWKSFMQGFGYVTTYVKEMYELLMRKGYLLAYLRFEQDGSAESNRSDRLQTRVIELALVAYVLGDEKIEEGTIGSIVADKNPEEWNQVLWSINAIIGDNPDSAHLEKAKKLVDKLISVKESGALGDVWHNFFKGLGRFLKHLSDPSELLVSRIFKIVAADKQSPWELGDLVEYLHLYRDSHPKTVGNLYTELLSAAETAPSWPPEKVRDVCRSLVSQSETETMVKICRIYSSRSISCEPIRDICSGISGV